MKIIDGGVTAPKGFKAAGISCGLKKNGNKDLALVVSECSCTAAGTFTTNAVKAAPVQWCIDKLASGGEMRAVILNSGNANCCTGANGIKDNERMAEMAAKVAGISPEQVFTGSTGVIGQRLDIGKIENAASALSAALSSDRSAAADAVRAIMTTDTVPKESAVCTEIGGKTVTVGGMSKGSGMIHPNMATMLCTIVTDAAVSRECLQKIASEVVSDTFNMISVDRDTSTNDSYFLLANGLAGNETIVSENEDYTKLYEVVRYVAEDLAKKMAADGEGATKLFEVTVKGAASRKAAKILARSVVSSNLVKAAIFGSDANWGRILCALGYSGESFDPTRVEIYFSAGDKQIKIAENGMAVNYSEEEASEILSEKAITITADLHSGDHSATAWGCDLTYDYVKINGDYRS